MNPPFGMLATDSSSEFRRFGTPRPHLRAKDADSAHLDVFGALNHRCQACGVDIGPPLMLSQNPTSGDLIIEREPVAVQISVRCFHHLEGWHCVRAVWRSTSANRLARRRCRVRSTPRVTASDLRLRLQPVNSVSTPGLGYLRSGVTTPVS